MTSNPLQECHPTAKIRVLGRSGGEKLAETEDDKLEGRTDGSDAFDTLCIGCEKFPKVHFNLFVTSSM